MPHTAMSREVFLAIVVVAIVVLLIAFYAIAKGRGFLFAAERGGTKIKLGVEGPKVQPDPPRDSRASKEISVLDRGKIDRSKVDIHVGDSIVNRKD